jgi:Mannosyltransferase putative
MDGISIALIVFFFIVLIIMIPVLVLKAQHDNASRAGYIKIMDNVEEVPTIKLIETPQTISIINKVYGNKKKKIDFNIISSGGDYVIEVPNYNDFSFSGKGLVIAASGNRYRYITGLYMNLYVLRKLHNSNIPIEIFYVGKKEEFSPRIKQMLIDLGNITIYNLLDRLNYNVQEEDLRGYQTKPLAVIASSFEEVIVMDADALCFIDPTYMFTLDGYISQGMLLFKDYVDCMNFISRDFIEMIGIGVDNYCRYTDDFEIDSSVVVVNKEKYWDALYTICVINVKSDSYHKSKNVLGDKDTWLIGSLFNDHHPYISTPTPKIFISDKNKAIVGHLQSTLFDGKEMFTHYNNQKIIIGIANISDYTYAEIKNPIDNQEYYGGIALPEKILITFKYAREAMTKLEPEIPSYLKERIRHIDGVSVGLI